MDCLKKQCIINASNGAGWFSTGTKRLKNSLIHHGYTGDILTWDNWPNDFFDKSNPYHVKAAAFAHAIDNGYTHILWLDCSVWAIKDPNPIFDLINDKGYYMWSSGFNCAQTCSDKCLEYFGVSRNEAEKMEDCSSSMLGVNLESDIGKEFIQRWIISAQAGIWNGSREHDHQSADPRFLFHRQDQSAASIIANQLGMKYTNGISHYYTPNPPESVIFLMRGI